MAEFSARRVVAVAAIAGALVGGMVAGGVAAVSSSGRQDSTRLASGAGSVATAAVVRTDLTNSVQVGGSIGYRSSYTIAAPSGASAEEVAQAQQAVTQDQTALSADQQTESGASAADNQAIVADQTNVDTAYTNLSVDKAKKVKGCAGKGASTGGVPSRQPDRRPGPRPADSGPAAARHRPVDRHP